MMIDRVLVVCQVMPRTYRDAETVQLSDGTQGEVDLNVMVRIPEGVSSAEALRAVQTTLDALEASKDKAASDGLYGPGLPDPADVVWEG